MLKNFINIALLIFVFASVVSGQEKIELKNADELSGKVIDGQNVREANGNVEFAQGNVKVYCNSATQFIDVNRVELRGNVKIYQDTLTLLTSKAVYFGDDKKAVCEGGVTLKDPNATLRANNGVYFFNETKAVFKGNVIIINPQYNITSDELTYLRNTEDSFAKGNVIVKTDSAVIKAASIDFFRQQGKTFAYGSVSIESDSTIIYSDTATNYSAEKKSVATGNVKIETLDKSIIITGNSMENYERENYTILKDSAKLMRAEEGKDTVFIYSNIMEAYRNKPEYYVAEGDVRFIRNDFYSKCGRAVYYKDNESVSLSKEPVVWQENMQMTGDSIFAELPENKLQSVFVRKIPELKNSVVSFVVSGNADEYFKDRYDQISGDDVTIKFVSNKINFIEVKKNSRSIYFVYDNDKANGINNIEGDNMYIYFGEDEKVEKIKVESDPKGEYIPENLLGTANLTLPGFNLREDKPFRIK